MAEIPERIEVKNNKTTVKISKSLSWILRHGAKEVRLVLDENGWADLEDVLKLPQMKKVDENDIKEIVKNCPKRRFALKETNDGFLIRANQGHSLKDVNLEMDELNVETCPLIYHGTYLKFWPGIKERGLSIMNRQHVHFTDSIPSPSEKGGGVVSKIRSNCDILIEVDAVKLVQDGYKIYKSENDVILCSGNDEGVICHEYFTKCINIKSASVIWRR